MKHFSTPETSPLGLGEILHQAIGNHGMSEFSNRVLQEGIMHKDKSQIKAKETKEILQKKHIPPQPQEHSDQKVKEAIDCLLEPDLYHPNTRFFVQEGTKKNKIQQNYYKLPPPKDINHYRTSRFHQQFSKMERINSFVYVRIPHWTL